MIRSSQEENRKKTNSGNKTKSSDLLLPVQSDQEKHYPDSFELPWTPTTVHPTCVHGLFLCSGFYHICALVPYRLVSRRAWTRGGSRGRSSCSRISVMFCHCVYTCSGLLPRRGDVAVQYDGRAAAAVLPDARVRPLHPACLQRVLNRQSPRGHYPRHHLWLCKCAGLKRKTHCSGLSPPPPRSWAAVGFSLLFCFPPMGGCDSLIWHHLHSFNHPVILVIFNPVLDFIFLPPPLFFLHQPMGGKKSLPSP